MGNPLFFAKIYEKKRASIDEFRQNINAFFAEFENEMREIVLFQLLFREKTTVLTIYEK